MTVIRRKEIKDAILDLTPEYPVSLSPLRIWEQLEGPLKLKDDEWVGFRRQFDRLHEEKKLHRRKNDTYYKMICVGRVEPPIDTKVWPRTPEKDPFV